MKYAKVLIKLIMLSLFNRSLNIKMNELLNNFKSNFIIYYY